MTKHIYLCEDSTEGIFTAVYDAWEGNHGHTNNQIQIAASDYNTELFCEYHPVTTDFEKAEKVARTIDKKISSVVCQMILTASLSYDSRKADAIYRMIIYGLHMGGQVIHHLANPDIAIIEHLNKNVNNEIMHLNGFLRFEELKNGILLGRCHPKNDIIRLLGDHFADRFPDEAFIIADTNRQSYILHAGNETRYLKNAEHELSDYIGNLSDNEMLYQSLWKCFVDTIAIKPRTNLKLQRQNLPLRFRDYMPEFSSGAASESTFSTLRSLR